ncbi:hypothetical protein AAFF_G00421630 [Aldrovandia affinis]|uniref:Uncharacterized protein n=1 Tax=Aldrovandia affinis TaxID=143900 RepID=A0AAD7S9V9_9TELE|nr:hypothetical protein AAFF_G00421630 [Aldrovandia affinis]
MVTRTKGRGIASRRAKIGNVKCVLLHLMRAFSTRGDLRYSGGKRAPPTARIINGNHLLRSWMREIRTCATALDDPRVDTCPDPSLSSQAGEPRFRPQLITLRNPSPQMA